MKGESNDEQLSIIFIPLRVKFLITMAMMMMDKCVLALRMSN